MNNRTENKLKDISGMSKAGNELLMQAWERGRKYGRLQALEEGLVTERWIPIAYHEITDEERKEEDYPDEWVFYLDCPMPEDGQRILVQTKSGRIELDECIYDDCYSLDSGYDWRDDIVAWMPLPELYEENDNG